ncbi:MAG: hypothetical protein FGM54_10660 [Chitinophagaceae bacterium]|nr:hypothetical protein [Chitinophagaceae bacterium]
MGALLLSTFRLSAQTINIKADLSKSRLQTGETADLRIELIWPTSIYQLNRIQFPDTAGVFEFMPATLPDSLMEGEHYKQIWHRQIRSFEAGTQKLPPIYISLKNIQTQTDTLIAIPGLQCTIIEPEVDTTQAFKPIQPIEDAVLPWEERLQSMAWILALLALIGVLAWWWFKRKKNKPTSHTPTPVHTQSPYQIALQRLQQLQNEAVLVPQGNKAFYTELTDALRAYFEAQYQLPCFEKTASEIIALCQQHQQLKPSAQIIEALFTEADLIKFAKAEANESTRQRDVQRALHILETNKPITS